RFMAERDELGIIADQIGTPTWANSLAKAVWQAVEHKVTGIHHWSDAGVASWYDFAYAIMEEGIALGLLNKSITINAITTADYPTPASRPCYSVMDKTTTWKALDMKSEHWRVALRQMMSEL
ncbi:MAG: sugar nucleotide-binding protein, partial [Cocleimonas sp.]